MLFTCPAIKSADLKMILNKMHPSLIVNFRIPTETSHWYVPKLIEYKESELRIPIYENLKDAINDMELYKIGYDPDTTHLDVTCISFPIPDKDIFEDGGKNKNKSTQELCQKIVMEYLQKDKVVLLTCLDGTSTCGFIAHVCKWWYLKGNLKEDIVKELRDNHDYMTAKSKKQIAQIKEIQKYAFDIMRWENFCLK